MSSNRAAVTHFDGESLMIEFWLKLYERFWRGEVDKIYADCCFDSSLVGEEEKEYVKKLFLNFPEIDVVFGDNPRVPEKSNNELIPKVTEKFIMLIEGDGFIFERGLVSDAFEKLELYGNDIAASEYRILPQEVINRYGSGGFMRNFFFIRKDLLDKIDVDFLPKPAEEVDLSENLDCFGWISLQLVRLNPSIFFLKQNVIEPDSWMESSRYLASGWCHVRQMNSGVLGFGNGGNILKEIDDLSDQKNRFIQGGPSAEFQFIKACAFRHLAADVCGMDNLLLIDYLRKLDKIEEGLGLSELKIATMASYFKGIMRL